MKEIKINKLSIRNFKGCGEMVLELRGKDASVFGDNAAGKTTIYDALTWLLFGKDSKGSADQELIKPLDKDGSVKDHEAITCVEAELTVTEMAITDRRYEEMAPSTAERSVSPAGDGRQIAGATVTLRKEMQEAWVTRRGISQVVYDGNEFRYYVDDVPCKKNEYARRVGELVDEGVFKLLTSVTAFAQDTPWRKRREVLYDMSGVSKLSDRALMQQMAKEAGEDGRQIAGATGGTGKRIATSPAAPRNDNAVDAQTLEELAEQLGSRTLEELQKLLAARRKALTGTRSQIPARLDELNRQAALLEAQDYASAEAAKAAAEAEIERIRDGMARIKAERQAGRQIAGATEAERKLAELDAERKRQEAALDGLRAELRLKLAELDDQQNAYARARLDEERRVREELDSLENENKGYRTAQEAALPDLDRLKRKVEDLRRDAARLEQSAARYEEDAGHLEAMLEQARQEWLAVSGESFGGAKCPTCGQELPMEQMQAARERFEAGKAQRLAGIRTVADGHKQRAEADRANAKQDRERLAAVQDALNNAAADLMEAEKQPTEIRNMEDYPVRKKALVANLEALKAAPYLEGYLEQRDALTAELKAVPNNWPEYIGKRAVIDAELRREADEKARRDAETEQELAALSAAGSDAKRKKEAAVAVLANREALLMVQDRMEALRKEQKQSAAQLEQIDRLVNGVEEFIRWKTRFIEDSVNGLFRVVTFRLFKELISGGLEECCDVVVNGVPYAALNNGARINAGMDIIRRLAEHYGVRVPLFVDNAESVTRLEDAGTQVIRLVVSEQDKSLRVETMAG